MRKSESDLEELKKDMRKIINRKLKTDNSIQKVLPPLTPSRKTSSDVREPKKKLDLPYNMKESDKPFYLTCVSTNSDQAPPWVDKA